MAGKIVVTGATSGLGLALIDALGRAGYEPVLTGRRADRVARLAADKGVSGYVLDVSDPGSIASVTTRILRDHGPVYGLVNNAGIWLEGAYETHRPATIRAVIDTNTTGTMLMTHALLPAMLEQRRGVVVNVVSTGALYCRKMIAVYAASKWAIRGFTGCLEVECAPKGVRVMGFYPGKIETSMYESAGVARDLQVAMAPDDAAAMVATMIRDETMVWSQVAGRSIRDYL